MGTQVKNVQTSLQLPIRISLQQRILNLLNRIQTCWIKECQICAQRKESRPVCHQYVALYQPLYMCIKTFKLKKYTLCGGKGLKCLSHLNIGRTKNCQNAWSHLNKTSAGAQQQLRQQLSLVQTWYWGPPLAIVECSINYLNIYYFKSSSFSSSRLCFLKWCGICTNRK